jgi:hypothetical protein
MAKRVFAGVLAVLLLAAACSEGSEGAPAQESVMVQPDLSLPPLNVNVVLTDDGFEPDTIFLPAGRQIRLVLRNRGTKEHHFRIEGLIPGQLAWMLVPELSEDEIDSLTEEQLMEYGLEVTDVSDASELEHYLHHLKPTFVPTKETSPAGVKPLGTEVHGYVTIGTTDTLSFYPLNTGTFKSEDVLFPEITGTVIVFAVEG